MRFRSLLVLILSVILASTAQITLAQIDDVELRRQARQRWEPDILRLLELDKTESYPADAILLLGSSSIRLWETAAADLAPRIPIRRGFGGAKTIDVAVFATELIQPHAYAALVIFVANDITGETDADDYDPDLVARWMQEIVDISRAHQPTAPIVIIEITPNLRRWEVWQKQRQLNHRLRDFALTQPNTYFLSTAEYFLTAAGNVRTELFVDDNLHLNQAGYRLWSRLLNRRLDELLNESQEPRWNPAVPPNGD